MCPHRTRSYTLLCYSLVAKLSATQVINSPAFVRLRGNYFLTDAKFINKKGAWDMRWARVSPGRSVRASERHDAVPPPATRAHRGLSTAQLDVSPTRPGADHGQSHTKLAFQYKSINYLTTKLPRGYDDWPCQKATKLTNISTIS